MADNVSIDPGTTTPIATRDLAGIQHQVQVGRGAAFIDRSSTVTTGGTAQQIAAANTTRTYLLIQNVSTASLWVNVGVVAVQNQPSILLPANGGSVVWEDNFIPTGAVSLIGATTGQAFTCKEA